MLNFTERFTFGQQSCHLFVRSFIFLFRFDHFLLLYLLSLSLLFEFLLLVQFDLCFIVLYCILQLLTFLLKCLRLFLQSLGLVVNLFLLCFELYLFCLLGMVALPNGFKEGLLGCVGVILDDGRGLGLRRLLC